MAKRGIITLLLLLLLLSLLPIALAQPQDRYILEEPTQTYGAQTIQEQHILQRTGKKIIVSLHQEELKTLLKQTNYRLIGKDKVLQKHLQDATTILNATRTWNLTQTGIQLNGTTKAVCVIDTGVDEDHPDLQGKVIAQQCYCTASEGAAPGCCPDGTTQDNNATDNDGHGTHVAGIIAATGNIEGIATGTNIVAVKILNSSGVGYDTDLKSAINWCSNDTNIQNYNITAISLSLGGGQYNTETSCQAADSQNIATTIANAITKNISVVVSTGNTNGAYPTNNAGLASPACLPQTIRVTATTKADLMANYAFRNNNFTRILAATGSNINSTYLGGGYLIQSGTSMAAPMVAGTIAILNQYANLSGQTFTPTQILTILNNTGKRIDDTSISSQNYTRINTYEAILNIDNTNPEATLLSPQSNTVNQSANNTFICQGTDWQLQNVTFYLWNQTQLYTTNTTTITGTNNTTSFNVERMPDGTYYWNCKYTDQKNNLATSTSNNTLIIGGISVTLTNPANATYTKNNQTNFTCTSTTEQTSTLTNITFNLWNQTGTLIETQNKNITGTNNITSFNYTLPTEQNYHWNCRSYNNKTNNSQAQTNNTITYDNTRPLIQNISTTAITSGAGTINWYTNEQTNTSIIGSITGSNTSYSTNHSQRITGLSTSTTYTYNITSCDRAGNCNTTQSTLTTTAAPSSGGSSGGGSGGGSSGGGGRSPPLTSQSLIQGYTKTVTRGTNIRFTTGMQIHNLQVLNITTNKVQIVVQSDPIYIDLYPNTPVYINITSPEYYDIEITLNQIYTTTANITIKQSYKQIEQQIIPNRTKGEIGKLTNNTTKEETRNNIPKKQTIQILFIGILLVILLTLTLAGYKHHKHLHRKITSEKEQYHGKTNKTKTQTKRKR